MKTSLFWLGITLLAIVAITAVGPAEKSLGANVRIVYLHGVWVWTALASFLAAGIVGLIGLIARRRTLQSWSLALGRSGLLFWITYLPISMWAMQTNWNGMFLAEPRFRVAVIFVIGGLMMQIGVAIAGNLSWAAIANVIYILVLLWVLRATPNVMHPPSPILSSDAWRIQLYFFGLLFLALLLGWQIARLFYLADKNRVERLESLKV
jgi:hypothetical protein